MILLKSAGQPSAIRFERLLQEGRSLLPWQIQVGDNPAASAGYERVVNQLARTLMKSLNILWLPGQFCTYIVNNFRG